MSGNDVSITPPQSIAEVEQLVKRLYQPGPPLVISQIDSQLKQVQLSREGWQVADSLLGSDDPNVRFFGALTFTVKLNNDGSVLDAETAQAVQRRLVSWFVRLIRQGEIALVTKKLCSTLTTYCLRSPVLWKRPLLDIAVSMQNGDAIQDSSLDTVTDIQLILHSLDLVQIVTLLWFSDTLADEAGRLESNTATHAQLHSQMEVIVRDASALMSYAFTTPSNDANENVKAESLKSFSSWVNYAQPVWPRKPECLQYLRDLIQGAIQCIINPALQQVALDCFRDILESYTSFFQSDHMQMLALIIREHVQPILLRALRDQDPDGLPYGQMVIAFGNANIQQVVEHPGSAEGSATIIKLHLDILKAPGYPGDEDELSVLSIEFWNTYIEYVSDVVFSGNVDAPGPHWLSYSKSVLTQLIELLWAKMWTPPAEIARNWTDSESDGFKEFRLDATDLMLSTYVYLGKDMLLQLISLLLRSLEAKEWRAVEAALFSLNALADNVLQDETSENILASLFGSSLFPDIGDFSQNIPSQARRTAIDILGSYGPYIERHAEYLPDTVRFLFSSLETANLANTAAKSIAALCSTCRISLTGELDGFLLQYQGFLSWPTSDPYTKEKVIGAIAAIIQALKPESAKVQPLLTLLENVEKDVQAAKDYAAAGDSDMAELTGVAALNCLASIGKGMQVPSDIPIDLYDDDGKPLEQHNYWESPEGQIVQHRIMGCFSVLQVLGNSGDAVTAACQVLRSGFAESEPGPFVLPPSITVSFLQQCTINTPQLESVLGTACTLIIQHSRSDSKRIDTEVSAVCEQVAGFIQQLSSPAQDSGVAQSCIDVLRCLPPYYVHILLDEASPLASQLPTILDFTIAALESPDHFPKRSAAAFWAKFIKPPSPLTNTLHVRMNQVISVYGPQLALAVMRQIGGLGQRSELESLCEPLKALISTQSATKSWLEAALFNSSFPEVNSHFGNAEKQRFVQQLVGLRGDGKKMKEVVKGFYAACRGTVERRFQGLVEGVHRASRHAYQELRPTSKPQFASPLAAARGHYSGIQ